MKKLLFISLIGLTLSACHSGFTHNSSSDSKSETREVYSTPQIDNTNATIPGQGSIFLQPKTEKSVGKQSKTKAISTAKAKKKAVSSYPTKKRYRNFSSCDCGYGYCYGPRGGRYCYTSGGNKSYR
ncbi:TPA: hypothetical protein ACU207_002140 [Mannheimia haemolytica]|uniref:hypothetical protein n=1 Tax=Mannheimia haemolytica TaxID=75985 RepID=UPI00201C4833|nr:hypothetical protein [Mannheimia haemolytica]UQX70745.1 hypothetical protein M3705_04580 [Mannheimia haemolytica]HDL1261876.1 hypothetical protein [Mannheimia haemolytica]HDL5009236.1 hypothetical protein [Mannheimia haemolytica]